MNFVSASPSIIRSVLQRSLLNTWQRQYDRGNGLAAFAQFEFARLEDERPDMIWFEIVVDEARPRFRVVHHRVSGSPTCTASCRSAWTSKACCGRITLRW